ncbi:MAG: hypothetical protein GEU73_00850 [Chloroflexi bacterium]|nr:hypothetical protein [Chloroflexota bacterium]
MPSATRRSISFSAPWRDGYLGTLQMGLKHGAYCLRCCWLRFVIPVPLRVMNLAAMAALTLLIFAETSLPPGPLIGRAASLVLVGYGILALFVPSALSTFMPMLQPATRGPRGTHPHQVGMSWRNSSAGKSVPSPCSTARS